MHMGDHGVSKVTHLHTERMNGALARVAVQRRAWLVTRDLTGMIAMVSPPTDRLKVASEAAEQSVGSGGGEPATLE
jgi:hypothetical protein